MAVICLSKIYFSSVLHKVWSNGRTYVGYILIIEQLCYYYQYLCKNRAISSTFSLSGCRKSFRKYVTLSYVICPQTTICLLDRQTDSQLDRQSHFIRYMPTDYYVSPRQIDRYLARQIVTLHTLYGHKLLCVSQIDRQIVSQIDSLTLYVIWPQTTIYLLDRQTDSQLDSQSHFIRYMPTYYYMSPRQIDRYLARYIIRQIVTLPYVICPLECTKIFLKE